MVAQILWIVGVPIPSICQTKLYKKPCSFHCHLIQHKMTNMNIEQAFHEQWVQRSPYIQYDSGIHIILKYKLHR